MDKYIAAAKAFWTEFRAGFEAFLSSLSGKDSGLFEYISKFISSALKIDNADAADTAVEEEE